MANYSHKGFLSLLVLFPNPKWIVVAVNIGERNRPRFRNSDFGIRNSESDNDPKLGCMCGCMCGCIGGCMCGCMCGCIGGSVDGCIGGCMCGCIGGSVAFPEMSVCMSVSGSTRS